MPTCETCHKGFTRSDNLRRHMRELHSTRDVYKEQTIQSPKPPKSQGMGFHFIHPFTMTVAGPTASGKTVWTKHVLEHSSTLIQPSPYRIIWFYRRWQPLYSEMAQTIPNLTFIQGIPHTLHEDDFIDSRHPHLLIFDDLMKDATQSKAVCDLYTEGSHHRNLSVINLLQNLYYQGKENRTMNLNSQYLVLFKNPRDRQQVAVLARQMYPQRWQYFMDKFQEATSKPYGCLLIDLKQETSESNRLKDGVMAIKGHEGHQSLQQEIQDRSMEPKPSDHIAQLSNEHIKIDPVAQLSNTETPGQRIHEALNTSDQIRNKMINCSDCGVVFKNQDFLTKHKAKGCPGIETGEEPDNGDMWYSLLTTVHPPKRWKKLKHH